MGAAENQFRFAVDRAAFNWRLVRKADGNRSERFETRGNVGAFTCRVFLRELEMVPADTGQGLHANREYL